MREQTNNRVMTDEPDRQDLEDRVEQLESTISKMLPGRREALKLGGAALVGGAAMSGSASAGTQQAGTIGTANNPVDLNSEDIDSVSVSTERIGDERHYAGAFDGPDADQRLDAALTAASSGDTIYLENAEYSADRTVSKVVTLVGDSSTQYDGAYFSGTVTFSVSVTILGVGADAATVTLQGRRGLWFGSYLGTGGEETSVTIEGNRNRFLGLYGGAVTFASGTTSNIVDGSVETNVVDNGTNTVGDIA